jgi:hypothetical protein
MKGVIRPQVKVERLALDPTFEAGSTHTAKAALTNPTTKDFTYTVELYLDVTKAATSGAGTVTIAAGQSVDVNFTLAMPLVEKSYQPYLDVWVGTSLIAHYAATELVSIVVTPAIIVGPITWA